MMVEDPCASDRLANLQRLVTTQVTRRLAAVSVGRVDVAARLRRLEAAARRSGADRQTLQVITSGRRLLGDMIDLTPKARQREPSRRWLADPLRPSPVSFGPSRNRTGAS